MDCMEIMQKVAEISSMLKSNLRFVISLIFFSYTCLFSYSQNEGWQVYPAYREPAQVEAAENYLYCIMKGSGTRESNTGNLVRYDTEDGSVKTYDCLNELSDKEIFTVSYNPSTHRLLVLYANGNIDILCQDDEIINISSLKANLILGDAVRSISHIGDEVFLLTPEHIIIVDVAECVIRQSFKVANNVRGVFGIDNVIYVANSDGIYKLGNIYELSNSKLWEKVCDVEIDKVVEFAGHLYVITPSSNLNYIIFNGDKVENTNSGYSFSHFFVSQNRMVCFNYGGWFAYYESGQPLSPIVFPQDHNWQDVGFVDDMIFVIDNMRNLIYYSFDKEQRLFVQQTEESILQINSPKRDFFYHIHYEGDRLLVAGGINATIPAYYPVTFMYMEPDGTWIEFDETQVSRAYPNLNNVNAIALAQDPNDNRHFFGAVWRNGLHEYYMNESGFLEFKKLYDRNNSPIQSIDVPVWDTWNYTTCTALQYDKKGNLWMANQHTDTIVRILRPDGKWLGLFYPEISASENVLQYLLSSHDINFVVTYEGSKRGFFGFDTNGTLNVVDDDRSTLRNAIVNQDGRTVFPTQFYCMAEDMDGQIWCGTNEGLFVITNPQEWFSSDFRFHQIKINRDDGSGFADYLLSGVDITCIAVDPANRKWIGTAADGVYLVSPDGQETICHFMEEDSPLLSNRINSIAVHPRTGLVMFGTDLGLCSYDGQVTESEEVLEKGNVIAFPNPVHPNTDAMVTIKGLTDGAEVKILSSSGRAVWATKSVGGSVRWNCCNMYGERVASGVYHVVSNTEDASTTVVTRIVVLK